jgi:hypothetical protein
MKHLVLLTDLTLQETLSDPVAAFPASQACSERVERVESIEDYGAYRRLFERKKTSGRYWQPTYEWA